LSDSLDPSDQGPLPRILCCDIDAFYCQAAQLTWPDRLRGVDLLLVGGHPGRRGVVVSCSYAARQFGVHSAMPMASALRLCPDATAVPVPWATVRRKSREVFAVLRRSCERMERSSIDEGYLLLGDDAGPTEAAAHGIRDAVQAETAITISIGGASVRFLAKMASGLAKPRPGTGATGILIVPPGGEYEFIGAQPLGDIPGIGPSFLQSLQRRGISSVAAARRIDLPTLTLWLGPARARFLHDRVRGIGGSHVADGREQRKSISAEETFSRDLHALDDLERELGVLVADVGRTLRKEGLRARTVGVKLRNREFRDRQRNRTLPEAVETDAVLLDVARSLLAELRERQPGYVRLLGVTLGSLEPPPRAQQLTLPGIARPLETDEDRRAHGPTG
jgi:DNA polymerase IV